MSEKFELVDINGKGTGIVLIGSEANHVSNIRKGCYMPVVGVIIINNKNEILLQKHSRNKKMNPGKWGICGGKINLGENSIEAGIRETMEEISVRLNKEEFKFLNMTTSDKGHFTVYYVRKDIDIDKCILQKEEVEELRYFKMEEIEKLDNEGFEWLGSLKEIIEKI